MWHVTQVLEILPIWIWGIIFLVGIFGLVLDHMFRYLPQYLLIKISSIAFILISVWVLGAYSNEEKWQSRIKDLEEQISKAKDSARRASTEIETSVTEKTKLIKGRTEYITQYIDREVVKKEEIIKFVQQCPLPKDIIDLHNSAADTNKSEEVTKK